MPAESWTASSDIYTTNKMNAAGQEFSGVPEETKEKLAEDSSSLALPNAFFSTENPLPEPNFQTSPEQVSKKQRLSLIAARASAEATGLFPVPIGLSLGAKIGHALGSAIGA